MAEDYSFPYTQVFGFMAEFCKAGGHVPSKSWVPIGTKDYSSVIAAIPDDVDAIYVALGGADGINFLTQYQQAGGQAPLIGGSITVDQTILGSKGKIHDVVIGTPSAGPIADSNDTPEWKKFVEDYKKLPDAFPSPSLFAHGYYVNMQAALTALDKIGADVSDGGAKLREALSNLVLDTPTGKVTLDKNRNAIADMFLTEVVEESRRHALQQAHQGDPAGEPDARHSGGRVPEARQGHARQSKLPVEVRQAESCPVADSAVATRLQSSSAYALELDGVGRQFRRAGGALRRQH